MVNTIRENIESKDILFQQLFTKFQSDLKKNPNYIKFDAFKDLKIIFDLYSETYHLKGYNYNDLKKEDIVKLIKNFDNFQKRELVQYLIKSLAKNGIEKKAKELFCLLTQLEINCCFTEIKQNKSLFRNVILLLHNLSIYNSYTLMVSPILYILLTTLIYSEAPYDWMKIIEVNKLRICDNEIMNNISNVLLYIFDFDSKMNITPLNFAGVIMLVLLKSFLILIIINFFLKELFNRIKLS